MLHRRVEEIAAGAEVDPEKIEEEAAKRNAPRGTWDQVRSILAVMEERGMTRFYVQGKFDPDELEVKFGNLM